MLGAGHVDPGRYRLNMEGRLQKVPGAGHVDPGRYRLNMEGRLQKVPLHLTGIVKVTWMLSGRGWLGY